jgi:hypothetical protein
MSRDDDISGLSPQDLQRVCLYIEDRFVNAVTPLAIRLQRELPGVRDTNPTLETAQRAVDRILEVVDEVRWLAERSITPGFPRGLNREAYGKKRRSSQGVHQFILEQAMPD